MLIHWITTESLALYSKHVSIVGATGGTKKEFYELIEICRKCKVKIWKKFRLEDGRVAIESLFSKERNDRNLVFIYIWQFHLY